MYVTACISSKDYNQPAEQSTPSPQKHVSEIRQTNAYWQESQNAPTASLPFD